MSALAEPVERDIAEIEARGFVVITDLLAREQIASMRDVLRPLLRGELLGRNNFEGHLTERVYSLVGRHRIFEELVEHPRILGICDVLLEANYLLTASQAINILPGETPQPFHTDDLFYRIARPRRAVSVSTIFAIDPFTSENGATQIVPGSHTWEDKTVGRFLYPIDFSTVDRSDREPSPGAELPERFRNQVQDVTMSAGSVIVFLGTLVHRGGENRSDQPRLALSNQYCEPWARQQENYMLSIPRERARAMSERIQQLLGYSIHPPFMGHVNGIHPRRVLEERSE